MLTEYNQKVSFETYIWGRVQIPIDKGIVLCDLNYNHSIQEEFEEFFVIDRQENVALTTEQYRNSNLGIESFTMSYFVCDSMRDFVISNEKLLFNDTQDFVVSFVPIFRADQPESYGWRWHKWGTNVGKYEPKHEYLYDEDISHVFVASIYWMQNIPDYYSRSKFLTLGMMFNLMNYDEIVAKEAEFKLEERFK